MADLFGAPQGIIASNELANTNMLSGLKAQEMLGTIAMQPAEMSLKQSQARLYGAEAGQKELANQNALMMLGLQKDFMQQQLDTAKTTATQNAGEQGRLATVADLPAHVLDPNAPPPSIADPLEKFAAYAVSRGVPPMMMTDTFEKIAAIKEKEGVGAYRSAQANEIAYKQTQEKLTRLGGVATAAIASPQQFAQAMLDPETAAMLPKGMNLLTYEQALPHLQHISTAALTTVQQNTVARQFQTDAEKKALDASTIAKNKSTAAAADARTALTTTYRDNVVKNGGTGTAEAKDAKESATTARDNADAAKFRLANPIAPLDPSARTIGNTYSSADGLHVFKWVKDPATGKVGGIPVNVPVPRALRKAADLKASMAAAAPIVNAPETADMTGE